MKINELYQLYLKYPSVQTDTRKIREGDIYFALKGENFNGNTFANEAIEKGAAYCIIDEEKYVGEKCILVKNVLETLQELATYHRKKLSIPVIGITGSNGKTTTKELIKSVLSQKFNVFATYGNLNNHIGVPLSILSVTKKHDIAIIEMGANHQKEIAFLSAIAQPDLGLITNIGKAHLEGFGGEEGVLKGKTELFDYLIKNNKKAFICSDEMKLVPFIDKIESITYGIDSINDVVGKLESSNEFLTIKFKTTALQTWEKIETNLIGAYNFNNILAAIAIGNYFNLSISEIKKGVISYTPSNNRSQILIKETNKLILDAYNANPSSMKEAITNFVKTYAQHKLAILGEMRELGEYSEVEHKKIVDLVTDNTIKTIFVGKEFKKVLKDETVSFASAEEAGEYLKSLNVTNHLILVKGSRGIQLEKTLNYL